MKLTVPENTGRIWITVLLLVAGIPEFTAAQTPVFDQLKAQFEKGKVFHAAFSHEYQDSYTGEQSRTEGIIWISREKYRVESDDQVMVVDGEVSRVYDSIRNRLLISRYDREDDDFAPSRMLHDVDDAYRISEEQAIEETGDTRTVVTLRSDDPFSIFVSVEIELDGEGMPHLIEAVDQVENLLITRFGEGRFLKEDPGLFELKIPGDAERIDLRH